MRKEERILIRILAKIDALKSSNSKLKSERELLLLKIEELEKQIKEKQEITKTDLSTERLHLKEEIDRQIVEIDTCLDLLKNI